MRIWDYLHSSSAISQKEFAILARVVNSSVVSSFHDPVIQPYVSIGGIVLIVCTLAYATCLLIRIILMWKQIHGRYMIFEVKPLKTTEQSSFTTTQLFTAIHGIARQQTLWHRLFRIDTTYAFEIVSTKANGIRYLLRIPKEVAGIIKKNLIAYLPGIQVNEATDYIGSMSKNTPPRILEVKLTNHFAFPLKKQANLEEYDPIAYITGVMTKLAQNELVSFQLVLSPLHKAHVPVIQRISHLIYANKDVLASFNHPQSDSWVIAGVRFVLSIALRILLFPIGLFVFIASEGREGPLLPLPFDQVPSKTTNIYQEELTTQIKNKIDQQLFTVAIRLMTSGNTAQTIHHIEQGFVAALSSFANAGFQMLVPKKRWKISLYKQLQVYFFVHRIPSIFVRCILSTSEVADLYHFPYTSTTKTENILKQHSKELPAPLSLKQKEKLDVYFAKNTYGGTITNIGLTQEERRRHMYILGATGTGKSTLLLSMINQDMKHGKGLCVIDPHGDLIEKILPLIPLERMSDVIYFNPDDIRYPIGINLLELTSTGTEEEKLREKEFITESIISLFHKLYPDRYSGPRMEYILRNTIHTAFTTPHPTIFTIYKLLVNTPYRSRVTADLMDENLHDFWKYEFAKAGDYQKVKMISPITNKIGRFLFSAPAKRILEQQKSRIDFDDILDSGKIFLCNLSKGKIGEDNSEVFGILLLTKIQLAALKRARRPMEDRKDFYLYVDEFQNFATPSFAQILSEARKYRLNAILAHQTTSQLEDRSLVHVTLANTGTIICFRTANPEDERLILPQFTPYIDRGEIANLPSFHFYMKITALNPEEPFSGETILVEEAQDLDRIKRVIDTSRKNYAHEYTTNRAESVQAIPPPAVQPQQQKLILHQKSSYKFRSKE